jgi:amidase
LPQQALERAAYLDSLDHLAGPLHGLPISIKEQHGMTGLTTHASYIAFIGQPQVAHTRVNEVLLEAGAIFYARTTQPQCVMHLETSSNIYGITLNPHNLNLTPGGSSGGESALIAMRGSILVSCSSNLCNLSITIHLLVKCWTLTMTRGLVGILVVQFDVLLPIRESTDSNPPQVASAKLEQKWRLVAKKGKAGSRGQMICADYFSIPPTQGPLSTSRSGLSLFMKSYLHYQPWIKDDSLVPLPWRTVTLPPRLKIAVMWSDGIVTPHPPILRALKHVAQTISHSGLDVVEWMPEGHDTCWDITQSLYFEDGGRAVEKILNDGEDKMLPLTRWLLKDNTNVKHQTVEEICAVS